jgi:hypothetical protein
MTMHSAEDERKAVVAWLRAAGDYFLERGRSTPKLHVHARTFNLIGGARLLAAADAIEAGSHVKEDGRGG